MFGEIQWVKLREIGWVKPGEIGWVKLGEILQNSLTQRQRGVVA